MPESRNNYKKTDIKLELINELRARSMTRTDIQNFLSDECKRLGKVPVNCKNYQSYMVSNRTVKRVIDSIGELYGNQLDFNKEFGTYKLDLRDFPDTIDDTEIQALDVALQRMDNDVNMRSLLERLKSKLTTRLYRKIEYSDPRRAISKINDIDQKINSNYAFIGPRRVVDFDKTVKDVLDSAITNQHEVQFKYHNKKTTVRPLGIMYGPNNVYLIAYGYKNTKIDSLPRYYILSEMSELAETQNWFARDDNFSVKEYANSMFGVYNDGMVYDVEWLIKDKKTIQTAEQYIFHPSQKYIYNPDGTLSIKMRTGGLYAISVFLMQWGGNIIPIAPTELVTTYKQLLHNCIDSLKNT